MVPLYVLALSAATFSGPAQGEVLDFTASYCHWCRENDPIVSRLERQGYPIRKVDVEREPQVAQQFGIRSMPTFVLVVNGKEVTRLTGFQTEDKLLGLLNQIPRTEKPLTEKLKEAIPFTSRESKTRPVEQPLVARAKIGDAPADEIENLRPTPLTASVRIRVQDGKGENFGSGTVIDSRVGRTLILTCGHIFRNLEPSSVIAVDLFHSGRSEVITAKLVKHDMEADVGLIAVATDVVVPACRIAPVNFEIAKNMPVVSVGCGGGEKPSVQQLRVTALNRYLGPDNLECSGVPVQGRSGGGLFTPDGLVIGVCTAADPRDQRGIYAGLKAVQQLLTQCQLAHLYQPNPKAAPREIQIAADSDAPAFVSAATTADANPAELVAATNTAITADLQRAVGETASATAAPEVATNDDAALREALEAVGHAEVVCVIRPIGQPQSASRVVVINRASPRFVAYLTDEFAAQSDVRNTALTTTTNRPTSPTATKPPTGPQPYRRNKSRMD